MSKFRVIIGEDEEQTRIYLRDILSRIHNVEVVGEASNGKELIEIFKSEEPDVILADIDMPELDGMKAVTILNEEGFTPYVVFLTGLNEYALDAFELSAIDYIVKPVRLKRLKQAFEKIENLNRKVQEKMLDVKNVLHSNDKIHIKMGSVVTFIDMDSIIMIESKHNKTYIFCRDTTYETADSLSVLEEKLNNSQFFRSHKSFIVNLKYISQIRPLGNRSYEVVFQQPSYTALISRSKVDILFSLLDIANE